MVYTVSMGQATDVSNAELARELAETKELVQELVTTMKRFLPLLESYERAKNANGFLASRRALKG